MASYQKRFNFLLVLEDTFRLVAVFAGSVKYYVLFVFTMDFKFALFLPREGVSFKLLAYMLKKKKCKSKQKNVADKTSLLVFLFRIILLPRNTRVLQ